MEDNNPHDQLPPALYKLLKDISFNCLPGVAMNMLSQEIEADEANDEIHEFSGLLSRLSRMTAEECTAIHAVIAKYLGRMEYDDGKIITDALDLISDIAENRARIEKWNHALICLSVSFIFITAALTSSPFPDNNSKS